MASYRIESLEPVSKPQGSIYLSGLNRLSSETSKELQYTTSRTLIIDPADETTVQTRYPESNASLIQQFRRHRYALFFCATSFFLLLSTILLFVLYLENKTESSALTMNESKDDVFLCILQTNDIYEIKPMAGLGGFSHLAALRKSLPGMHVLSVFAGDLISPSPLSLIPVSGEKLKGEHMIDLGNDLFDISAIGNHEFDYGEKVLKKRLAESRFTWLRTNLNPSAFVELDQMGVTKPYDIRSFKVPEGYVSSLDTLRVAFIGLSRYDHVEGFEIYTKKQLYEKLPQIILEIRQKHQPHLIIAITHFDLTDDVQLVAANLGIDLVFGGHEHENIITFRPPHQIPITKADSDGRSAYIHKVYLFEPQVEQEYLEERFPLTPTVLRRPDVTIVVDRLLKEVNTSMPQDTQMDKKISKWWDHARKGFLEVGYNPDEFVYNLSTTWDLRRDHLSSFVGTVEGKVFVDSVSACGTAHFKKDTTRLVLISSGQVRIDALITPRILTVYDIMMMSPFFETITRAKIQVGKLLRVLQFSVSQNVRKGGFLLWSDNLSCNMDYTECSLDNKVLQEDEFVEMYTMSFLLTGKERNMSIMKSDDTTIFNLGNQNDEGKTIEFQRCIIDYLKKMDPQ